MKIEQEINEIAQIEMTAKGCISGTLAEWPLLKLALKNRGIEMLETASAKEMRDVCKFYLSTPHGSNG
jgi:hypothetical protein